MVLPFRCLPVGEQLLCRLPYPYENRRRVSGWFGLAPDRLATVNQVHSPDVVIVDAAYDGTRPKADALVTLYHGDCLSVMGQLAPHFGERPFDLLLTDPPYGLGKRMSGGTWGREERYGEMWKWDVAPSEGTVMTFVKTAKQAIVWGGNYFSGIN